MPYKAPQNGRLLHPPISVSLSILPTPSHPIIAPLASDPVPPTGRLGSGSARPGSTRLQRPVPYQIRARPGVGTRDIWGNPFHVAPRIDREHARMAGGSWVALIDISCYTRRLTWGGGGGRRCQTGGYGWDGYSAIMAGTWVRESWLCRDLCRLKSKGNWLHEIWLSVSSIIIWWFVS